MKCHYEILGVEQSANEEAIKKAYRKKALKWHPDKNLERLDEATEHFRLIQAAYDVLIDPQERAWYDRHRDEILHKSAFSSYNDDTLDLLQYFTPSAYKGYGQDSKSFYSVYGDVFKRISEEDKQFCSDESDDEFQLPDFGNADSDYDEVVHTFYAAWQAYCTKLSYVWLEKYNVRDAPDRRVARMIEKENKKERDKEKKKRNEIVRDLVRFIRKRDPRVRAHKEILELRAAEKAERAAAKRAEMFQARVEEAALYEEQNWNQRLEDDDRVAELEEMLKDEFGFSSEDDSTIKSSCEDDDQQLYCVACDKQMKTMKALKNHQKNKKHKENLTKLQFEMHEDVECEPLTDQFPGCKAEKEIHSASRLTKSQKKRLRQQKKLFGEFYEKETEDSLQTPKIKTPDPSPVDPDPSPVHPGPSPVHPGPSPDDPDPSPVDPDLSQADVIKTKPKLTNAKKKPRRNKISNGADTNFNYISASESPAPTNFCSTCKSEFPSRNKLFKHLKSTGHSLPLDGAVSINSKKLRKC